MDADGTGPVRIERCVQDFSEFSIHVLLDLADCPGVLKHPGYRV